MGRLYGRLVYFHLFFFFQRVELGDLPTLMEKPIITHLMLLHQPPGVPVQPRTAAEVFTLTALGTSLAESLHRKRLVASGQEKRSRANGLEGAVNFSFSWSWRATGVVLENIQTNTTELPIAVEDTLQLALCRGVSVAEDWDESLPLLCWALDIDTWTQSVASCAIRRLEEVSVWS